MASDGDAAKGLFCRNVDAQLGNVTGVDIVAELGPASDRATIMYSMAQLDPVLFPALRA